MCQFLLHERDERRSSVGEYRFNHLTHPSNKMCDAVSNDIREKKKFAKNTQQNIDVYLVCTSKMKRSRTERFIHELTHIRRRQWWRMTAVDRTQKCFLTSVLVTHKHFHNNHYRLRRRLRLRLCVCVCRCGCDLSICMHKAWFNVIHLKMYMFFLW